MSNFNWKGSGPGGCDNHCIPHPCGPCITGFGSKCSYELSLVKKENEKLKAEIERIKQSCCELYTENNIKQNKLIKKLVWALDDLICEHDDDCDCWHHQALKEAEGVG